jgi:hypothetical protein
MFIRNSQGSHLIEQGTETSNPHPFLLPQTLRSRTNGLQNHSQWNPVNIRSKRHKDPHQRSNKLCSTPAEEISVSTSTCLFRF